MSTRSTRPEPGDRAAVAAARRERLRRLRAWLSAVSVVVLLAGAALVFLTGYGFFGVVLCVLAVFAAADLAWVLRRQRRR